MIELHGNRTHVGIRLPCSDRVSTGCPVFWLIWRWFDVGLRLLWHIAIAASHIHCLKTLCIRSSFKIPHICLHHLKENVIAINYSSSCTCFLAQRYNFDRPLPDHQQQQNNNDLLMDIVCSRPHVTIGQTWRTVNTRVTTTNYYKKLHVPRGRGIHGAMDSVDNALTEVLITTWKATVIDRSLSLPRSLPPRCGAPLRPTQRLSSGTLCVHRRRYRWGQSTPRGTDSS